MLNGPMLRCAIKTTKGVESYLSPFPPKVPLVNRRYKRSVELGEGI